MADVVRVEYEKGMSAVSNMRTKTEELRSYLNNEVTSTVMNMSSWWSGDAYERFKEDFNATKSTLEKQVLAELETYINNLEKAIQAQRDQDTLNAGSISIN